MNLSNRIAGGGRALLYLAFASLACMRPAVTLWSYPAIATDALAAGAAACWGVAALLDLIRLKPDGWRNLILAFCDDVLVRNGMVADWAVHRRPDGQGSWAVAPHAHLIITARGWRPERNPGRRNAAWFGSNASLKAAEDQWQALLVEAAQEAS